MTENIRPVAPSSFVASSDPATRVNRRPERGEHDEQSRRQHQHRGEGRQSADDDVPAGDPGTYDDHGRRGGLATDTHEPEPAGGGGEIHVDRLV